MLCQGQEDSTRWGARTPPITAPLRGSSACRAARCVAVTIPTNASASSKLVSHSPVSHLLGASPPLFRVPPGHSLIKQLFLKQAKLQECHFKPPLLLEAEELLHLPSVVAEGCSSHLLGHPQPKPAEGLPNTWPSWQKGFPMPFCLEVCNGYRWHPRSPGGGGGRERGERP